MSEEDIKIIKELLNYREPFIDIDGKYCKNVRKAIENLINRNKELEEKSKNTMKVVGANYISKDKIIKKIEEIQNEYFKILENNTLSLEIQNYNAQRYEAMRNVLEELLEESCE